MKDWPQEYRTDSKKSENKDTNLKNRLKDQVTKVEMPKKQDTGKVEYTQHINLDENSDEYKDEVSEAEESDLHKIHML